VKITVLGTANAWGVNELAGITWPLYGTLSSGDKVPFRKYRTSLLVETHDNKKILVDCGPDFTHQRREFNVGVVDAILLTHPHLDHIGGLDECNVYRNRGYSPIPTYAHPDCWSHITNATGFGYLVDTVHVLYQRELKLFQPFSIGTLNITAFGVEHSVFAPGSVGYIFEETIGGVTKRVIYTGDWWAISNPAHPAFSANTDVVIMECDRVLGLAGPKVGGGHMSFQEILRVLSSGVFSNPKPSQIVLVHFGDSGPQGVTSTYQDWRDTICNGLLANNLQSVMLNPDMVIAYDGMSFAV